MCWQRWFWCAPLVILAVVRTVDGQAPAEERWLVDRTLTVTPQAAPVPALKYRLFPLVSERRPGNAAPIYLRFAHERNEQTKRDLVERVPPWVEKPLDQLPRDEVRTFLGGYRHVLRQLELGARRQTCDWNYTLDQGNIFEILLPDAQELRMYSRLLVLSARLEIASGNYAEAAHALETGFAFSEHLAEGPFLINALVGLACANHFTDGVADLIERPGSPNLYWSLSALPRPLIGLRRGIDFEFGIMDMQLPDLASVERPRTPGEWEAAWKRVSDKTQELVKLLDGGRPGAPALPSPLDADREYAAAKKYLADRMGLKNDAIQAMPRSQALLLAVAGQYREVRDDWFRSAYLPYPEARPLMEEAEKRLREAPASMAYYLARSFFPTTLQALAASARVDRKVAVLRVVEALRLNAAANGGRLPESLEHVKEVPIPLDPMTGRPFEYRREGAAAILLSRIAGEPASKSGLRVRVNVRR